MSKDLRAELDALIATVTSTIAELEEQLSERGDLMNEL